MGTRYDEIYDPEGLVMAINQSFDFYGQIPRLNRLEKEAVMVAARDYSLAVIDSNPHANYPDADTFEPIRITKVETKKETSRDRIGAIALAIAAKTGNELLAKDVVSELKERFTCSIPSAPTIARRG